jgi:hypothetical protein
LIMDRYHGNYGLAVLLGLLGVAILTLVIWVSSQAALQLAKADFLSLATGIFLFLTFLSAGVSCLFAAGLLGSSYLVDDRGITRRSLRRATIIAWADLDRFEEVFSNESGTQVRYRLYAADGRRILIPLSYLADGDRLRTRLEEYLAPLRERASRELAKSGRHWRPDRTAGLLVVGFMAPLFILGGLRFGDQGWPGRVEGSQTFARLFGALCVAAGPVLVVLGAELISRVLSVTGSGIALRSLFFDRKIVFGRVESVTLRMMGDAPGYEQAKIRGDGRAITIDSNMTGYREVMELMRSRSGVEPVRAGAVAKLKQGSPRRPLGWAIDLPRPVFMWLAFPILLIGGWRLYSARTAAGDGPRSSKSASGPPCCSYRSGWLSYPTTNGRWQRPKTLSCKPEARLHSIKSRMLAVSCWPLSQSPVQSGINFAVIYLSGAPQIRIFTISHLLAPRRPT